MTEFKDGYRVATPVLVDSNNQLLGQLPPIKLSTPWFQEISELVRLVSDLYGIDLTIIRILEVDDSHLPEIEVSYLVQVDPEHLENIQLHPWNGQLDEQSLRLPYAEPGGPDNDIAWAAKTLSSRGFGDIVGQQQIRTWNLSSIWRLETNKGVFWLKSVPPFFAHEGEVLGLFVAESVPNLVASDPQRILMHHLPGEDCYNASLDQMLHMIGSLVDLQWRWRDRLPELIEIGLPDVGTGFLERSIPAVINAHIHELSEPHQTVLSEFSSNLASQLAELAGCGFPAALVHGDYHPGNWRGTGLDLTILDWGDCCIGHPLLDMPALLSHAGNHLEMLKSHWLSLWKERLPDADVESACKLIEPIAAARMAAVYQHFLENIEPNERIYHDTDPVLYLNKTATLLNDN